MKKLVGMIIVIYARLLMPLAVLIFFFEPGADASLNADVRFFRYVFLCALWLIVLTVFVIINMVQLVKLFNLNDTDTIRKLTYRIKYSLIPYWILSLVIDAMFAMLLLAVTRGFGLFLLPVLLIPLACILLITSTYSILYILFLWKNSKIKNSKFLLHLAAQFFLILDIVSLSALQKKFEKEDPQQNWYS